MKKKVVFILMAAVTMLTDCQNKGGEDMAEEKSFETMTVSKQDITLSQSYPASVEGRQSVKIIPRVEGYLREIKVKEGQRVKNIFAMQRTRRVSMTGTPLCFGKGWTFAFRL